MIFIWEIRLTHEIKDRKDLRDKNDNEYRHTTSTPIRLRHDLVNDILIVIFY